MRTTLKFEYLIIIILLISTPALADGIVDGEECPPAMDAAIYFMTIGPGSDEILRVSLYEHWGDFYIYIDEIWYDDIEGLAHYGDSYELSDSDVAEAVEETGFWRLEFIQWLDGDTFELKANDGEVVFTVEHIGEGIFQICRIGQ